MASSEHAFAKELLMNPLIWIEFALTFGLAICLLLRAMGVGN